MSDTTTEVRAVLTAEDRASQVVRKIKTEVDALAKSFARLAKVNIAGIKDPASGKSGPTRSAETVAKAEVDAMRALRQRWAFQSRMARQQAADVRRQAQEIRAQDRERRAIEAVTMRDLRQRMALTMRMARQQAAEIQRAERERLRSAAAAERDEASALRRRIAGDRWRFALRERMDRQERHERERARRETIGRGRDTLDHGRDALRNVTRPIGIAAIAGTATAGIAARKILGAESDVDRAEINSRAYGGLSADAARSLRDRWAAPLAEELGAQTDKLLTAWTDAVKLGIPAAGAQAFAELSTKTSEAWEVPFEQVTDIMGTVNTLLTSKGEPFSIGKLHSVANSIQHLAAKQSTTPEKLISFLQRGAGAAQVLGMSQEAGLAFGSASTSLGNQAGQSGRMFDYIASRIIELPRLVKQHGQEGEQAKQLLRSLGYGSAQAMDAKRRASPDEFLADFLGRFNRIRDPRQQDQAIRFFTGREWLGEFGRMVKGIDTYKEAVKLAKEAKGLDAIGSVWELHRLKLAFVFKQFRAGWLNILGEFGKVLSPMARQAGDTFLAWSAKLRDGGLAARFRAGIEGIISGLGFKDLPALLTGIFGNPGEGAAGAVETWRATARGFGRGIRDVVDALLGAVRIFSGGSSDPEIVARWTARIMAFSAAMLVAAPAVTVLGGLTSAILALGTAAMTAWSAVKLAGLVSGSAAGAAGVAAAAGLRAVVARLLGGLGLAIVAELGARRGEIVTAILGALRGVWDSLVQAIKADFAEWSKDGILRGVLRTLDPNLPGLLPAPAKPRQPTHSIEPGADVPGWRRILDWWNGPARVERQSYSGQGFAGMIRPAAFDPLHDIADNTRRMARDAGATGARLQLAALAAPSRAAVAEFSGFSGGGSSGGSSGFAAAGPGGPGDPAKAFGRNFFTPGSGGPKVPGWFGKGSGGAGSGGAGGSGLVGYGANPGAYKPFLDYVARAEGTAGGKNNGYDVTLANGALLPGGKEQDLTKMTLDQIDAMQSGMLRHPGNRWNSSAAGRYQIVQKTLRGLRRDLGLRGDQLYDEALQDRLGAELARRRGANAGPLGDEWASLKGGKGIEAARILGAVPRDASTIPGPRPAEATGTGTGPQPGNFAERLTQLRNTGAISNAQCVSLAKAWVGAPASVTTWRKGDAVTGGEMKPGTPIATFLNRDGSQSNRYAGGGTGTPGANLDHAGVFHSYITDKNGKRVGMKMLDQWNGANGQPSVRDYYFGDRRGGEKDAGNYFAVKDQSGNYLGGARNPMSATSLAGAPSADGFKSSGWQPGAGGNAKALGLSNGVEC